jgi:protease IV
VAEASRQRQPARRSLDRATSGLAVAASRCITSDLFLNFERARPSKVLVMSSDAEIIADRRRLRRKLSFWRVLAVAALVIVVVAVGWRTAGGSFAVGGERAPHVARVTVEGLITSNRPFTEMLARIGDSPAVQGVVISVNSPGGTTTGSEEVFHAIRGLAEKKPTVTFVDGTAASGAYIAALATDHIVARETAIVGSIGTLFQLPNFVELLDNIGVSMIEIKSSPLKAAPSPVSRVEPAAMQAIQSLVDDSFVWFRDLVASRRPMSAQEVASIADGRVHSGRQALGLKLVDQLGSHGDAVRWLETERGVEADLPVREWKPRRERDRFSLITGLALGVDVLGFERASLALHRLAGEHSALKLDGLLAVWQPRLENQ